MENRYDVIIIGAGPAGLAVAEELENTSLSVLLVEKNSVIGPKICAGGITNFKKHSEIPPEKMQGSKNHTIFIEDKKYELTLADSIRTISRANLGEYQAGKITGSKNITLLKGTSAKSIGPESVVTDKGIFSFRYLVGADGSASLVRKHLGLGRRVSIGLCCDVEKVHEGFVWYVNPRELGTSYIWEFPHHDHTNIGIYFDPKHLSAKRARAVLITYLEKRNHRISPHEIRGGAVNYDFRGCVFGNIFLAGDAAGLASKPSGEGISFALASGREIGKKILDPGYEMTGLKRILKLKKRQEKILSIFESFPPIQGLLFRLSLALVRKRWIQRYFAN
ncbi:MAG: NAD(P)/FAD-dependent oxidoreductase [Deltaproteobacteria bacterium]|nr:NAD(P)/FAD-dependent oxidoreductase [Deltaproteobacteria bacterium]MBN2846799.1 NAD(P)/FAD-dependent oxidoreductase [Deltaproteobacteria bacterium]